VVIKNHGSAAVFYPIVVDTVQSGWHGRHVSVCVCVQACQGWERKWMQDLFLPFFFDLAYPILIFTLPFLLPIQ